MPALNATHPRTLHVIGGTGSGGAERFAVRLINALARRGEAVAAVTVANGAVARALSADVRQFHAPMAGGWDLWSRWRIGRAIAAWQPDVVQTYMGRATRLVRLHRGQRPVHLARLGGFYKLRAYRHAHAWVGNTRGLGQYLVEQGLPESHVHVVGNFVDPPSSLDARELAALKASLGLAESRVLLGVGRLHPYKGWEDLLRAFARLPARTGNTPLHLIMVGDGPLREALLALCRELGLNDRVHWLGWQSDPGRYYQLADVSVCASTYETLGNVILEAWANRALVVSTRAQGPLELIRDSENGLLAPPGNPAGLAEVLQRALDLAPDARAAMIAAGAEEIRRHYTEAAIVAKYVDLYALLRDQAGNGPGLDSK